MAAIKDLNDVSSAILDMDTLAMDSMDMHPEAFPTSGAPGAQSKETMSSDSRAGEREQQDGDDIHEIDDTGAQEIEYRVAKETNHDLMTDPGTPGTLQEVFSEDGHETKGMAEEETGYDDEGLMTDPGTPDTPQEEFRQDAQELDEIKDMNLDETEEEGGSDDEVLNLNSGSPQDDDFNPPGEIKDMNVDGPENDDLVVLCDGEGGEKSIDDGERFVAPFPITRVKRIIKLDKDVRLVTGDAIALIAQATALFVQNLSSASFTVMLRTKRKTIRGPDVVLAAKSTRQFRECLGNDLATLLEEDTANCEDEPVEKEHGTSDEPVRSRPPQQKSAKKHQLAAPPGSRPITNFFKA